MYLLLYERCPHDLPNAEVCFTPDLGSQELATILGDPPVNRLILIALHPHFSQFLALLETQHHAWSDTKTESRPMRHMNGSPDGWLFSSRKGNYRQIFNFSNEVFSSGASIIFRILAVTRAIRTGYTPIYSSILDSPGHLARSEDLHNFILPRNVTLASHICRRKDLCDRPSVLPTCLFGHGLYSPHI